MASGVETLEARRLMTVGEPVGVLDVAAPAEPAQALRVAGAKQPKAFAVLSQRTLTVRGTNYDDVMSFAWVEGFTADGAFVFTEARVNGQALRFPIREVFRVIVRAGRGNDDIDVYGNGELTSPNGVFSFRVTTFAGPGDDRITGSRQSDKIVGGPGNDTILARDSVVDFIFGGRGKDVAERDLSPWPGPGLLVSDRVRGVETVTP